MSTEKIKKQLADPKIGAVMVMALLAGILGTSFVIDNYVIDKPEFNQTELINSGVKIADNQTHEFYAKCEGNHSAYDLNNSNIESEWVKDYCWFTNIEKSDQNRNQTSNYQSG